MHSEYIKLENSTHLATPDAPPRSLESPYFDTGTSLLELRNEVENAIKNSEDPRDKEWIYSKLGLSKSASEEDVTKAITSHVEKYVDRYTQLNEVIPDRVKKLQVYLSEQNLESNQDPSMVPVILYDPILALTRPREQRRSPDSLFHPRFNTVILTLSSEDADVIHELSHAASYDKTANQCGWRGLNESGNPAEGKDCTWLDEGCTMMVEIAAGKERSSETWKEHNPRYALFWNLTQILQERLHISDQQLLLAYLKTGSLRDEVEQKVQTEFGCSVYDLDILLLGDTNEWYQRSEAILRGDTVELPETNKPEVQEKYTKLMTVFPNVHIVQTNLLDL